MLQLRYTPISLKPCPAQFGDDLDSAGEADYLNQCIYLNKALSATRSLYFQMALISREGQSGKLINSIARIQLLVIDDWGLSALNDQERRDLLEILEDRHGVSYTIVASQLSLEHWHEVIGNPTIADAILDRLIHNAYKINLKGESMRKKKNHVDSNTAKE